MNFEKLLAAFDMGICADQLQREALFDLALLFVEIDGVETPEELDFVSQWVDNSQWNSHMSKSDYRDQAIDKCKAAIQDKDVETFIKSRAMQLSNSPIKAQAIKLLEEIVLVDGELAEDEAKALSFLKNYLQ
ncbi:MAG: hypothetical protein HRT35_20225 [Algicola sp.]|nr:hypothetical protein [Algicola sp.]